MQGLSGHLRLGAEGFEALLPATHLHRANNPGEQRVFERQVGGLPDGSVFIHRNSASNLIAMASKTLLRGLQGILDTKGDTLVASAVREQMETVR